MIEQYQVERRTRWLPEQIVVDLTFNEVAAILGAAVLGLALDVFIVAAVLGVL